MFFVELSFLLLFVAGFLVWLIASDRLATWRDRKEANRVSGAIGALQGDEIESVLMRFGPPREQFHGSSGRSLYVWRRPPSEGLPETRGLLVVTLTVDANGRVVETAWERR
jgi:hypothetical protein